MDVIQIRRALVSVSDKAGLTEFCRQLADHGVEIVSSGGTAAHLAKSGVAVTLVSDVTGHAEFLGGRVKTLHPAIHGGILADRGNPEHLAELERHGIQGFDMVVSNLYPFRSTVARPGATKAEIIEDIDIGGPAMVRAAAKNHAWVAIVTSAEQYEQVATAVAAGGLTADQRTVLASEAFAHTAAYDAAIVNWMYAGPELPKQLVVAMEQVGTLRYGENPHQAGARYREVGVASWWDSVEQLGGLALSYLNLLDVDAAWRMVNDLGSQAAAVIVKHGNPCGASVAADQPMAYRRAYDCDPRSAFGGIVALNRPADHETADAIEGAAQADIIIAPGYEPGVVERIAARRKNTRILRAGPPDSIQIDLRQVSGGWLAQTPARFERGRESWEVVTLRKPTAEEWSDAELAWRVCGHVSSNAIVLVREGTAWGIGAGQQNRVEAAQIAGQKAAGRVVGGASASDAFYPFPDGIEAAASVGVAVVIQPGGSVRDQEVIDVANHLGLAMVFTGERQFLH